VLAGPSAPLSTHLSGGPVSEEVVLSVVLGRASRRTCRACLRMRLSSSSCKQREGASQGDAWHDQVSLGDL
jgi:hypothetical protein